MNTIEEKLMKFYWRLWADDFFEYDFAKDWFAVYRQLKEGNHYSIPEFIIDMCLQYMADWDKEN